MNKKIIIIALAFALPLTAFAFSGDKNESGGHYAKRLERLTENLNLTAEQKAKLEPILKEQEEKFKTIREETHKRMQEVLTKEQLTKMDEMKKQRRKEWQNKHGASKDSSTPQSQ